MSKKIGLVEKIALGVILICIIVIVVFFSVPDLFSSKISIENSANSGIQYDYNTIKLNVNTATEEELISVKGIGSVTAKAIIDYRTQTGGFTSLDQLLEIKGIGEKKLAEIKKYLTIETQG
jgi:comEA protein